MRTAEYKQTGTEVEEERYERPAEYDELGNLIHEAYTEVLTREVPIYGLVYRDMTEDEQAQAEAEQAEAERQVFEQDMANQGTLENKLELLLASIPTDTKPADRPGYRWKMLYNAEGNSFGWEEIPDPYYVPEADGDFTRPIRWVQGMTVELNKWYYDTDPDLPKECKQEGIADTFGLPWLDY